MGTDGSMYRYHHTSRTFLLGLDQKDYSQCALEWGMQELFEDNDEVVILRVIESGKSHFVDYIFIVRTALMCS